MEPCVCPVCGPSAGQRVAVRAARDHLFGCPGSFDLVRCAGCSSLRVQPRPTPASLGPFYAGYYSPAGLASSEALQVGTGQPGFDAPRATSRARWNQLLRLMGRTPFSPKRAVTVDGPPLVVVDAGCGLGGFLHHIRADPRVQPLGVEMAPEAVAYGRDKLGLDVREGVAEQLPLEDSSVDVLTLWHVLEHSPAPRQALAEAWRVLRPGGLLAVEVPSGASWLGRLFGRFWFFLQPPTHLNLLSPAGLERLVREADFTPLQRRFPFVPSEILGSLFYLFARPAGLPAGRQLGCLTVFLLALGVLFIELPVLLVLRAIGRSGVVRIVARKPGSLHSELPASSPPSG